MMTLNRVIGTRRGSHMKFHEEQLGNYKRFKSEMVKPGDQLVIYDRVENIGQ